MIELQWRGIAIVLLIVADVVFLRHHFLCSWTNIATNLLKDPTKSLKWLTCLVENQGEKDKCLSFAASLVVNQATVLAVLVLLSVSRLFGHH